MEALPNVAETIRRMSETFAEALSIMTRSLESLPKPSTEAQRRVAEQWLNLARTGKDSVVSGLNQGFDLWDRECRRTLGITAGPAPGNPMEAWTESWKKMLDAFGAVSEVGDAWGEAARKQIPLVQQNLQEMTRAWQRLWEPQPRKP